MGLTFTAAQESVLIEQAGREGKDAGVAAVVGEQGSCVVLDTSSVLGFVVSE